MKAVRRTVPRPAKPIRERPKAVPVEGSSVSAVFSKKFFKIVFQADYSFVII